MAGWYIRRGEKIVGPIELPKLQELVATGRLVPTDQLAKDVAGPWKEAGSTTLFAKPKQTSVVESAPPTSLVPKPESLPAVVEEPESGKAVTQVVHVVHVVFGGIGRGMLATWGAVSRSMATRSQRKHELKIAKIQAEALAKSQRPPAPQARPAAPPQQSAPQTVYVPQVHQTTVVQVVNKNTQSVYGCSGCGVVLLLLLIGFIVLVIMSSAPPP
jgi:hypothetical protein